jgi:arsenate reductase
VNLGLARRASAEFVGTALLVTAVVGSGIAASRLSPHDTGLQLLEDALATAFALGALVLIFGPVSGAHFNPVVSLADWWLHRQEDGRPARDLTAYLAAQISGAIVGAVLADVMFGVQPVSWSTTHRDGGRLWLAEIIATFGLVLLIFALTRTGRSHMAAPAVGAYIGAAYWFTASSSFANPAVTIGRAFTDTFAGIAPTSVPGFIAAQLVGLALAVTAVTTWYPTPTPKPAEPAMPPQATALR